MFGNNFKLLIGKSSASFISKTTPAESVYVLKKQRETITSVGLNPRFCCKQTTSLPFTKTPHFCLNFNSKKNV
jgi:hypothetical protein